MTEPTVSLSKLREIVKSGDRDKINFDLISLIDELDPDSRKVAIVITQGEARLLLSQVTDHDLFNTLRKQLPNC